MAFVRGKAARLVVVTIPVQFERVRSDALWSIWSLNPAGQVRMMLLVSAATLINPCNASAINYEFTSSYVSRPFVFHDGT